ncbi:MULTISPECIES: lycopene cyclase domain-containing protein [Corynebacterium]|uniref:lycopene cyclase domain-containing protein n=1 Tax=Corynebacterium TaxID=1716 RepID=UPI000C071C2C|nr:MULTISPECIES: lycopene cyclase domain-containing protein [Corynebacterium]MBF0581461.1 lycopene cyclase domain-containing protein [Corynebacterium sp. ED61]
MTIIYLAFLLLTLVCMVICDHRWKLAFFLDATRASLISIVTVGLLLVWDALGILNGVFYRGDSPYMLGIELAPEMPLEEPVFLFFLTYLTLNLTSGSRILLDHVRQKRILESGGEL